MVKDSANQTTRENDKTMNQKLELIKMKNKKTWNREAKKERKKRKKEADEELVNDL